MTTKGFWLVLLITVVQLATTFAGDGKMENVPFTSVTTTKEYEIRSYPLAKWVCKEHICPNFTVREQSDAYFALHEYAMGKNSETSKMVMTAPMTIKTVPNNDKAGNSFFQMCMYLPKAFQETPPKPIESGVFIKERQAMTVAVCPFTTNMMKETDWASHLESLRAKLTAANETQMDFGNYYGVSYDPPFKADGRHNEIWVVKKA